MRSDRRRWRIYLLLMGLVTVWWACRAVVVVMSGSSLVVKGIAVLLPFLWGTSVLLNWRQRKRKDAGDS